ncbi:dehydrogenase, partial [Dietzia schimae]|nr:dehydrogenase [Dietzia kunjamensis subsp. schimae]
MQVQDKVAVVTGAAGGIGAALAEALVEAGA